MAVCPFAIWRPLPENWTQPKMRATQVIYHTAVDQRGPTSTLFHFFNSTGIGVETHFYIRWDGTIEQYIDTNVKADGNRYANLRPDGTGAISIETEDDGRPDINPWSDAQLNSLVRLTKWLLQVEPGIARRVCRDGSDPGLGYHVMFGAPGPWTPSKGKTCPGAARIKQFPEVVKRSLASTDPTPPPPEEDIVATLAQMTSAISTAVNAAVDRAVPAAVKAAVNPIALAREFWAKPFRAFIVNPATGEREAMAASAFLVDGHANSERALLAFAELDAKVDALIEASDVDAEVLREVANQALTEMLDKIAEQRVAITLELQDEENPA